MQKKDNQKKIEKGKSLKGKKFKSKRKPILVVLILLLFVIVGSTFTWYLFNDDNKGDRKDIQIMTPYFLYLLNPDDASSLQFSVGNIHPGETKQIVICVSNKKPDDVTDGSIDIARESKFNYDLEFIYTENLPVNYDIYELTKYVQNDSQDSNDDNSTDNETDADNEDDSEFIMIEGIDGVYWKKSRGQLNEDGTAKPLTVTKDVTSERLNNVFGTETPEDVVNKGKYLLYQYDGESEPQPMGLEYKDGQYEFDYYLIEISWKDGIVFNDYTKETDLLYVVVNAKQPEPKAQTTEQDTEQTTEQTTEQDTEQTQEEEETN
jgi:hypothetical protein